MSPQTIRHLAVAVVATLGVVLLYLWPTTAKSPNGNPRQDTATSTSPTTPPATSPSSPSGTPEPPASSRNATPYNPHERVDTHRPPPNGRTSQRPGATPSTPSQRQTTPQPSTTPPPPPPTSSGPATSGSPSGGPTTTSPSTRTPSPTPTPSPTGPGTPTTEPPPDCDAGDPKAPQCLAVVEQTSTGATITWRAPMASDGLEGYQIYVRNQPYEPEEPIGTDPQPTVTITWPYQDDTTDPEVCVTALYPDGSDDDTDPDESERTCITVHQSDFGPSTSPSGSPGAGATPDGGGSSQPKEEESP